MSSTFRIIENPKILADKPDEIRSHFARKLTLEVISSLSNDSSYPPKKELWKSIYFFPYSTNFFPRETLLTNFLHCGSLGTGYVPLINIVLTTPNSLAIVVLTPICIHRGYFRIEPATEMGVQGGGLTMEPAVASFIIISCNFANGD